MHVAMIAALVWLALTFSLGWLAWIGIVVVALVLLWEHSLVKPDDFSRVDAAFFIANGYVSILFFVFWSADIIWNR
jgi:4-hydroxybenzoate polyprenyltransferase